MNASQFAVVEDGDILSFVKDGVLFLQVKRDGTVLRWTGFKDEGVDFVPSWFPCEEAVVAHLEMSGTSD